MELTYTEHSHTHSTQASFSVFTPHIHFIPTLLTWSAAALPLCSAPGLYGQMLCLQTPHCLSQWDDHGRLSPQQLVPLARTEKTPIGRRWFSDLISLHRNQKFNIAADTGSKMGKSLILVEFLRFQSQWEFKALVQFTCSRSSLVTAGNRLRTVSAALCVAKRILIGRLFKMVPSSSALAISASVRVSWKTRNEKDIWQSLTCTTVFSILTNDRMSQ